MYVQLSDFGNELLGLARGPSADVRFLGAHGGEGVDIPVDVNVDELYAIDYIWTLAEDLDYIHEALTDGDADWMSTWLMEKGDERRSKLLTALEDALDAGEITDEDFEREEDRLNTVPSWFFTVGEKDLDAIANVRMPAPDSDPPLDHAFAPWQRPTAAIFADSADPVNLQHIVASVQARGPLLIGQRRAWDDGTRQEEHWAEPERAQSRTSDAPAAWPPCSEGRPRRVGRGSPSRLFTSDGLRPVQACFPAGLAAAGAGDDASAALR